MTPEKRFKEERVQLPKIFFYRVGKMTTPPPPSATADHPPPARPRGRPPKRPRAAVEPVVTLIEKINPRKLAYCVLHFDDIVGKAQSEWEAGIGKNPLFANDPKGFEGIFASLKMYQSKVSKDGCIPITYLPPSGNTGRFGTVDGLGLGPMSGIFRNTIASEYYVDVDIVNTYPTLLLQWAERQGLCVPLLRQYVDHREEVHALIGLSKDRAKKEVNAVIHATPKPMSGWLAEFQDELKEVHRRVAEAVGREVKNPKGEFVGCCVHLLLSRIECSLLMAIRDKMVELGKPPSALIYDGMLCDPSVTQGDLEAACAHALAKTGYSVRLAIKPMEGIDVPERFLKDPRPDIFESGHLCTLLKAGLEEEAMDYTNRWFAHIEATSEIIELLRSRDGRRVAGYLSRTVQALSNSFQECRTAKRDWFGEWLQSPLKAKYRDIEFQPNMAKASPNTFNTFFGLRVENEFDVDSIEMDMSIVQPFLDHLRIYLCGGNHQMFEYALGWIANPLQNPGARNNTALVICGRQGIGKSALLGDVLGRRIYGGDRTGTRIKGPFHEMSKGANIQKFNGELEARLFVAAEEPGTRAEYHRQQGSLKGLITNETFVVELKGKEARTVPNHLNWVFLTNEDDVVNVEVGDRRFAILEPDNSIANNKEYFDRLWAVLIDDESACVHIYKYLKGLDLSGWRAYPVPQTDARLRLQQNNVPPEMAFLQSMVQTHYSRLGSIEGSPLPDTDALEAKSMRVVAQWRAYREREGLSLQDATNRGISKCFYSQVKRLLPGAIVKVKEDSDGNVMRLLSPDEMRARLVAGGFWVSD